MMSHNLCYLHNSRLSRHPTQPVVAQDSKHAYFQHQVSRNTDCKHVSNQNHQFCTFLNSVNLQHSVPLFVPADGDICAYRRWLVVLHPGCEVEQARQQQVDEGHDHRESQQAGLVQQGVLGGKSRTLLEVLFWRERMLPLVVLSSSSCQRGFIYFSQHFVFLLLLTTSNTAVSSNCLFLYNHRSYQQVKNVKSYI